jgi:hypothetical protein
MIRVMLSFPFGVPSDITGGSLMLASLYANANPKLKNMWDRHQQFFGKLVAKLAGVLPRTSRQAWSSKYINVEGCGIEIGSFKQIKEAQERFTVKTHHVGWAVYPFGDSLRYSCDPNTKHVVISNKVVTYVCKPIKKGSELSLNMSSTFVKDGPANKRKQHLSYNFTFNCDCEACVNDWPTIQFLRCTDPLFQYPDIRAFASHEQAKKNIARNNEYVNRNFKEHVPTKEVYVTIRNNEIEMNGLARASFYP